MTAWHGSGARSVRLCFESATASADLRSQEWLGRKAKASSVIDLLIDAYNAEIETVMNYIADLSEPRWRAGRADQLRSRPHSR